MLELFIIPARHMNEHPSECILCYAMCNWYIVKIISLIYIPPDIWTDTKQIYANNTTPLRFIGMVSCARDMALLLGVNNAAQLVQLITTKPFTDCLHS